MRVEIAYERRVEVFDTDRFTEVQPFSGRSMLADFTLEYEAAEKNGLWLTAHCYAANEGYRTDGEDVPEARREKGWITSRTRTRGSRRAPSSWRRR